MVNGQSLNGGIYLVLPLHQNHAVVAAGFFWGVAGAFGNFNYGGLHTATFRMFENCYIRDLIAAKMLIDSKRRGGHQHGERHKNGNQFCACLKHGYKGMTKKQIQTDNCQVFRVFLKSNSPKVKIWPSRFLYFQYCCLKQFSRHRIARLYPYFREFPG